jgi:Na+-driven multidrug efflux pump
VGNNILIGLSDGVGAIISYNYGQGSAERVRKVLKLAAISAFFIGVGIFIVISNFAREIIIIFIDENNRIALNFAVYGAKLYAFAFILNGLNIVVSGYFTAICYPKNSAFIALSKGIVWVGICLILLPKLLGVQGIWLTVPVAEILTFILSIILVRKHFKYEFKQV